MNLSFRPSRPGLLAVALTLPLLLLAAGCSDGKAKAQFPIAVTEDQVNAGKTLYAANCASCHGEPGVSLPSLSTAPPHDETGHTWHHADRMLFEWILDRPPLAVSMPAFRGQLSDDEVISILAYIKSGWPEDVQQFQREGSQQYEAQIRENPR